METIAITPKEAFAAIGVGKSKGWQLVASGELERFKVGTATRITTASVHAYVARRLAEANGRREPAGADA